MDERTCVICAAPLTGRRTTLCGSKACRNRRNYEINQASGLRAEQKRRNRESRKQRGVVSPSFQRTAACEHCGAPARADARYCSRSCASRSQPRARTPKQLSLGFAVDQRSDLRIAVESGDEVLLLESLKRRSSLHPRGCWIWQARVDRSGYPVVRLGGGRERLLHRQIVTTLTGTDPGFRPVHHVCAERRCVNPEHLQVVHPHENAAEMLERRYYLQRIADLEEALALHDPEHPLLVPSTPEGVGGEGQGLSTGDGGCCGSGVAEVQKSEVPARGPGDAPHGAVGASHAEGWSTHEVGPAA